MENLQLVFIEKPCDTLAVIYNLPNPRPRYLAVATVEGVGFWCHVFGADTLAGLVIHFEKNPDVDREAIRAKLNQGKIHVVTIALTQAELDKFKLEKYL